MVATDILTDVDERLRNRLSGWARWKGGGGFTTASAGYAMDYGTSIDKSRASGSPLVALDAKKVEAALLTLPDELAQPLALFWLSEGDISFREIGAQLGIDHKTAKARLLKAHERFAAELYKLDDTEACKQKQTNP